MQEHILSWITFIPLIGMTLILCVPKTNTGLIKAISLVATGLPLVLATWLYFGLFQKSVAGPQFVQQLAAPSQNFVYVLAAKEQQGKESAA